MVEGSSNTNENRSQSNNIDYSKNHQRSIFVTRQFQVSNDNLTEKSSNKKTQILNASNQGEATFLESDKNTDSSVNSYQQKQILRLNQKKSVKMNNDPDLFSPDDLEINVEENNSPSKNQKISAPKSQIPFLIRTTTPTGNKLTNPVNKTSLKQPSSQSQRPSKSERSTPVNTRQNPTTSKSKGAFHIYKTTSPSKRTTPRNNSHVRSSTSNTPSLKDDRKRITTSDDDEDEAEMSKLSETDLKLRLKSEKRQGKRKGEMLNKLHENYEELLEKYAQAENTIDQLRFQPKIFADNTPSSITHEGSVHIIEQPKTTVATARSSGIYRSTNATPISSIRPVPSTTTTTTTRKSISLDNSGTTESVYFDEAIPQKIHVEELTTPDALKHDLIIQIRSLGNKMRSFLDLMDANQLSLVEQKQIYDNIKQDYEQLINLLEHKRQNGELSDLDFDGDLNQELELMRQLLKDIVGKITDNLVGKLNLDSPHTQNTHSINDDNCSSQLSARSSLCNHQELMNQYERLLNTVNTDKRELPKQLDTASQDSFRLNPSNQQSSTKKQQKPYVYVSGDSNQDEDEEQNSVSIQPISLERGVESTSLELNYIPSTSVKHYQHRIEEQNHVNNMTGPLKYNNFHDNNENIEKRKRKQKELKTNENHYEKDPGSRLKDGSSRQRVHSTRKRTNDYDSGIGTSNVVKYSPDSKLYTSTMDDSHFQSLDDEQASISSSRSSAEGSASPRSHYRTRPIGHSETPITDSFERTPQTFSTASSSFKKRMHQTNYTWKPQRTTSNHRSSVIPSRRSASVENRKIENHETIYSRPLTALQIISKDNLNRNEYYDQSIRARQPHKTYRSSLYIDQIHTNKAIEDRSHKYQLNNLYVDSRTGIIYRYEPHRNQSQASVVRRASPPKLYQCFECGHVTTYHHRHHIGSYERHISSPPLDDLGYESEYNQMQRHLWQQSIDYSSSSDSDCDVPSNYLEMIALNEAYNQAEKIQYHSKNLLRYVTRQLKLALTGI